MRHRRVLWVLPAIALLAGCGYTTDGLHRTDISTVAVPIFQSREFRRGLEYDMTRELVRMIELRTPYKVTELDRADSVLEGTVLDLAETVLVEDENDVVIEAQVTLIVSYRWKDLRSGQVLRESRRRYAWHFADAEGQTQRSAQTTAIRKLAEIIVEDMEEEW